MERCGCLGRVGVNIGGVRISNLDVEFKAFEWFSIRNSSEWENKKLSCTLSTKVECPKTTSLSYYKWMTLNIDDEFFWANRPIRFMNSRKENLVFEITCNLQEFS